MRRLTPVRVRFLCSPAPRKLQPAMSEDKLQYKRLVEEAERGIMRKAMAIVAEHGLQGDHYFQIVFRTDHPGVDIPASLRREYPVEMPIILQNAFWDLEVGELGFSVSLSFNRVQQRLTVPFDAVTIFLDPPAEYGLRFQHDMEKYDIAETDAPPAPETAVPADEAAGSGKGGDEAGGDKVVVLDAFRNK